MYDSESDKSGEATGKILKRADQGVEYFIM